MRKRKYFEKTGNIYGVEYKMMCGRWCVSVIRFTDYDEASKWMHGAYGAFVVTRELACKSALRQLPPNVLIKEWDGDE